MAAVAITTTAQDITGDFDLVVRGEPTDGKVNVILLKSLGSGTTNWVPWKTLVGLGHHFVKNSGANSVKLQATDTGVIVEFNQ